MTHPHPGQTGLGPAAVEDRLAIINLLAAYAHYANVGDLDGWLSTFTEDVAFEVSAPGAPGRPLSLAEITALETPNFARYREVAADPYLGERRVYQITNPFVVRQEAERADVLCDMMIVRATPAGPEPQIKLTAGVEGVLVKRQGAWRIFRWRIRVSREPAADWAIRPEPEGEA